MFIRTAADLITIQCLPPIDADSIITRIYHGYTVIGTQFKQERQQLNPWEEPVQLDGIYSNPIGRKVNPRRSLLAQDRVQETVSYAKKFSTIRFINFL